MADEVPGAEGGPPADSPDLPPDPLTIGKGVLGYVRIPPDALRRHVVCFGASGSGKTVLAKAIIEEAVRAGIPVIAIDPQGDLASLAIPAEAGSVHSHAGNPAIAKSYIERAEVRIFTPASTRGIPLTVGLFDLPGGDVPEEDRIQACDVIASSLVELLDYEERSRRSAGARALMYTILKAAQERAHPVRDFGGLIAAVRDPSSLGIEGEAHLSESERIGLAQDLGHLTTGVTSLLFGQGTSIDLDTLLMPVTAGKVPVNIVYLNTLTADHHKQFVVAMVAAAVYRWMLRNPAKTENPQVLLYIDEVAPFMPPHPRNPPAKDMLQLLFKQGRKFGVACMVATQNVADVEYKAFGQASTWAIGRMMAKQDLEKLRHLLKARPPEEYERIMGRIPGLQAREFLIVSPDVFKEGPVQVTSRWLSTQHRTLDADALREAMDKDVWRHFVPVDRPLMGPPASAPTPAPAAKPVPASRVAGPASSGAGEMPARFPVHIELPSASPASSPVPPRAQSSAWPDTVLRTRLAVPQNEAKRRLAAWPGGQLRSGEEIVDVATEYLILWRAGLVVEKHDHAVPFLAKKVMARETVYVDARLDSPTCKQLLHVEKGITFAPITDREAHAIRDLDGTAEFDRLRRVDLGFDTAAFPLVHPTEVVKKVRDLFGIVTRDFDLVVLPVWRFGIQQGAGFGAKVRTMAIDSVFGLEVQR